MKMDEEKKDRVHWTAIVLTCPKKEWAPILQEGMTVHRSYSPSSNQFKHVF